MIEAVTGGCLCGNVRHQCEADVGPANYCHCEDCRRCTGSAFNVGVRVEARHFRIVKGSPRAFTKTSASGNPLTRHFCPECGSPLYTTSPVHPDVLYVKAGCIDQPGIVHPTHQIWMNSKVAWATIGPDLPGFPKGRP